MLRAAPGVWESLNKGTNPVLLAGIGPVNGPGRPAVAAGRAVDRLQLAGGVGDYVIRVFARNRREVNRLYNGLFERGVDPLSDEFQQARDALEGHEQYLMQLWREG